MYLADVDRVRLLINWLVDWLEFYGTSTQDNSFPSSSTEYVIITSLKIWHTVKTESILWTTFMVVSVLTQQSESCLTAIETQADIARNNLAIN